MLGKAWIILGLNLGKSNGEQRESLVELLPWFKLEDGKVGVEQLAGVELRLCSGEVFAEVWGRSCGGPWRSLRGSEREERECVCERQRNEREEEEEFSWPSDRWPDRWAPRGCVAARQEPSVMRARPGGVPSGPIGRIVRSCAENGQLA